MGQPLPTIIANTSNDSICSGQKIILTAHGANSFIWSPSIGLNTSNGNSVIASPSATMNYTVTGYNSPTCIGDTDILITVNPLPIISVSGIDSICKGNTSSLVASGGETYSWYPSTGLNSSNTASVSANPGQTQTYTIISQDKHSCIDSANFTLNVIALPQLQISGSQFFCFGQSTQLIASGADQYIWNPIFGSNTYIGPQVIISTNSNTTYNLIGINKGLCKDSISIPITVLTLPTLSINAPDSICQGQKFELSSLGNGTFNWQPSFNLNCSTCADPIATINSDIKFIVTITSTNLCLNKDSVLVKIKPSCGENIIVPNIFSPNGDGVNDVFNFKIDNIQSFQFEIFDRWGLKVFSSNEFNFEWDGKAKSGEQCSEGIYFYCLKIQKYSGEIKDYKGFLTLVK